MKRWSGSVPSDLAALPVARGGDFAAVGAVYAGAESFEALGALGAAVQAGSGWTQLDRGALPRHEDMLPLKVAGA